MVKIFISSTEDIDYSLLNKRIQEAERKPIVLVSNPILQNYVKEGFLTEERVEELKIQVSRRNRFLDHKRVYSNSKSGAYKHSLYEVYKYGLTIQNEYTLVELNLSTSLLQIIKIISNLYDVQDERLNQPLTHLAEELSDLFSGEICSDERLHDILGELLKLNNMYLNLYIEKAIRLSDTKNIRTVDAFNIERKYKSLNPVEAIIIPISYSLNNLQYVVEEKLKTSFSRGDLRFGIVHNYKMYYFVKNDKLEDFLNSEFYLERVKLDFTYRIIRPLRHLVNT